MLRVALISEARLYREGLQRVLVGSGAAKVTGAYAAVEDALPEAGAGGAEAILLQLRTLKGANLSTLRLLRQSLPEMPVVVLLDRVRPSDVATARQEGAAGCLDRNADAHLLVHALRVAAGGQFFEAPDVRHDQGASAR